MKMQVFSMIRSQIKVQISQKNQRINQKKPFSNQETLSFQRKNQKKARAQFKCKNHQGVYLQGQINSHKTNQKIINKRNRFNYNKCHNCHNLATCNNHRDLIQVKYILLLIKIYPITNNKKYRNSNNHINILFIKISLDNYSHNFKIQLFSKIINYNNISNKIHNYYHSSSSTFNYINKYSSSNNHINIILILFRTQKLQPQNQTFENFLESKTITQTQHKNLIPKSKNKKGQLFLSLKQISFQNEKNQKLKTYLIQPVETSTIGRSKTASVSLKSLSVSREHGIISFLNGHYYFANISESNGSYRKLQQNEKIKIELGIVLEIGENEFQIIQVKKGKSFTTQIMYGVEEHIDDVYKFKFQKTKVKSIGSDKDKNYCCLQDDPKLEAQHGIFSQDQNGDFWYQDNNSKKGTFIKFNHNKRTMLHQGQTLKFGDDMLFEVYIDEIQNLLQNSKPNKCKVCGIKKCSKITQTCHHFYCCEDCSILEKQCKICKQPIDKFENILG